MNSALDPESADNRQRESKHSEPEQTSGLKVSRFESVTSFLLAVVLFLGCFALLLLTIWLLSGEPWEHSPEGPPPKFGSSAAPGDSQRDFLPPSPDETKDLQEPTLEQVIIQVSRVAASVVDSTDAMLASRRSQGGNEGFAQRRGSDRDGTDLGRGPKRDFVPEFARWEIAFQARSKQHYAQQLDHFSIELAAFGGSKDGIDTASSLSSQPTAGHISDPSTEDRLYFSWKRRNPLLRYDQQLLAEAGIDTEGRQVIRFINDSLRQTLLAIEKSACEEAGKSFPQAIQKTYFECVSVGSEYQFRNVEQRYRVGH